MAQCCAKTDAIVYSGPDGDRHWIDSDIGIAPGHRRVAIIDLLPTSMRPMTEQASTVFRAYSTLQAPATGDRAGEARGD